MKNYLITLDVDGTLLDTHYRSTSPTISSVIKQMRAEGHVFLLNSNRALEDLLPVAEQFGLKGPIICENGCAIYDPLTQKIKRLIPEDLEMQINQLQRLLPEIVQENFLHAKFLIGDTTDIMQHLNDQDRVADIDYYFFMNQFRRYTISVHARRLIKGQLVRDVAAAEKLCSAVKNYVERQGLNLSVEFTTSYANVLLCPLEQNKGYAFNRLCQEYPDYLKIIVGDECVDKFLCEEVDYFFVVNNADEEAKELANYIAQEEVTKGVEEILLNIDKLVKLK